MSSFSNIQAPNPQLNATLDQGHAIVRALAIAGYPNPRLYANQVQSGPSVAYMIPETATQQNGDAPFVDVGNNLVAMGVPSDLAIYLQVRVDNLSDYFCVGSMLREMILYGASIKQVLA